jgi:hypothetical protein
MLPSVTPQHLVYAQALASVIAGEANLPLKQDKEEDEDK